MEGSKYNLRDLKKTLSWIFAILMIPAFLIFLSSYFIESTLINSEFYKTNLKKADTYNRLVDKGIPSLILDSSDSDDEQSLNYLASQGVKFIIKKSISPAWLEKQTEGIIDETIEFIAKPQKDLNAKVELDESQKILHQVSDSLAILYQIIPSCAETQVDTEITQLINVSINCETMHVNLDEIKKDIKETKKAVDTMAVNEINISEELEQTLKPAIRIKKFIEKIPIYMWTSLAVLLALAVLIIIIQFKNIKAMFKYLSLPILVASGLILIFALISHNLILRDIMQSSNFGLPADMNSIISDLIKVTVNQFFHHIESVAGVFFVISGIVFVVVKLQEKFKILKFKK